MHNKPLIVPLGRGNGSEHRKWVGSDNGAGGRQKGNVCMI